MFNSYFERKSDKVLSFNIVHFPNFENSAITNYCTIFAIINYCTIFTIINYCIIYLFYF